MKSCIFSSFCLGFFCFFLSSPLSAEWRSYESKKLVSHLLPALLTELKNQNISFQVKKVFNQKREGKEGFMIHLKPRNTLCKFIFYHKSKKQKYSLIRIFTENSSDSRLLNRIFILKLGMREAVIYQQKNETWPILPSSMYEEKSLKKRRVS